MRCSHCVRRQCAQTSCPPAPPGRGKPDHPHRSPLRCVQTRRPPPPPLTRGTPWRWSTPCADGAPMWKDSSTRALHRQAGRQGRKQWMHMIAARSVECRRAGIMHNNARPRACTTDARTLIHRCAHMRIHRNTRKHMRADAHGRTCKQHVDASHVCGRRRATRKGLGLNTITHTAMECVHTVPQLQRTNTHAEME